MTPPLDNPALVSDPTVEVVGLSKWFGNKVAVSDVTCSFGAGITGVLGPGSNAHGPNEFLHIPMAKKLTCCVAQLIADHALQSSSRSDG